MTTTDQNTTDQEEKLEWTNGEVALIHSEEAGTQIFQHQNSLTDYCSISSTCSREPLLSGCPSTTGSNSLGNSRSVVLSAEQEEKGSHQNQQSSSNPESDLETAETVNPTPPHLQAFTVLPVNGTLWIPRYKTQHTN